MQVEGTGLGDPALADRGFVLCPHGTFQILGARRLCAIFWTKLWYRDRHLNPATRFDF